MDTLDDLLSRRRRGALSEAEARRLRSGLRASPEHELSLLAGDAFERDGSPLPGDAERLQRIVAGALRSTNAAPRSRWPRAARALVVAPLFMAAAAAASVGGYRALAALREAPAGAREPAPATSSHDTEARAAARAPSPTDAPAGPVDPAAGALPAEPTSPAATTATRPNSDVPAVSSPSPTPRELVHPRQPEQAREPARPSRAVPARARLGSAAPTARLAPSPPVRHEPAPDAASAAQLFQRANALRRNDWSAAGATYVELIERYPSSTEAGVAEVALGKWSLALGRSGDALEWFRAHQRRGDGPLAAEALWGEARALESIGSHAAAQQPWQRLLERYPQSPYARVARERLRKE